MKLVWKIAQFDSRYIFRSWMFALLVLLGLLAVVFTLTKVTNRADMTLLPVTHLILSVPTFFFVNIILLLTFLYAGMLVHRERTAAMHELIDTNPVPNGIFLLAKTGAIGLMQLVLLLILLVAGVAVQVYHGYYRFEFGLYFFHLFIPIFLVLFIWASVSILVHTLINNPYAGLFVLILGWIGIGGLADLGVSSRLLLFNREVQIPYSDLNGYGRYLRPFLYVKLYWLVCGAFSLVCAQLLWYRGLPSSLAERIRLARKRFTGSIRWMTGLLFLLFFALGADIYRQEQKTFAFAVPDQTAAFQQFEQEYQVYARIVQPKITAMTVALDIYPADNRFIANGRYILRNKSQQIIDTLLVKTGFDEITLLTFNRTTELLRADTLVQFQVLKLQKGLLPGDSMTLNFEIKNKPNTFFERNSAVLHNGTFLRQDVFPRLGYFLKAGRHSPYDTISGLTNYQSIDADLIDFEAVVSTSLDQTAIAPGNLQRTWEENGRRFFYYKMDRPVKYAFSFHSGQFAVERADWQGVALEIFYHPAHSYNLDNMLAGLKAALAYNTQQFGPYQHQQARIVEFPNSEGSFATSFANIIPLSETRFITNARDTAHQIDLSFYVPAHELTHQWWGNQVMPADAHGSLMLTESITEYITLQVYEQQYGLEQGRHFLDLQRRRYLQGRTTEREEEPPLMLVRPNQSYLAYGKGVMAFHTMAHYFGEEKLNRILKDFLNEHKFQEGRYPFAPQLVEKLKKAMPDTLQFLLTDLFETVTFHSAAIAQAAFAPIENGQYQLDLLITYEKSTAQDGKKELLPVADYLEIGIYSQEGRLLTLERRQVRTLNTACQILLSEKPFKIVLDPNLLLLEMNLEDNIYKF